MTKSVTIRLKKDEERRVLAGHPWIYSNEIEGKLREYAPGTIADIVAHGGGFLGRGYVNPASLIAVRVLTRERDAIDAAFFARRFRLAKDYRDRFTGIRALRREIFAESDALPGLVIDRFGETLVIQPGTAGMEMLLKPLVQAASEIYQPGAVVLAGRGSGRELEGLPSRVEIMSGNVSDPLWVNENGILYPVDILNGQKTGFFLDQADNRTRIASFAKGRTLLDVFSYSGALALNTLAAGAKSATLLDASARSMELAKAALDRNGFSGRYELIENDAFPALRNLVRDSRQFDIVSTDPPALAKSKKHLPEALRAYQELATSSLKLTAPGGLYVASSCSYHVDRDSFRELLARAVRKSGRTARIIEWRTAGTDHPVCPSVPETDYLKCVLMAVE